MQNMSLPLRISSQHFLVTLPTSRGLHFSDFGQHSLVLPVLDLYINTICTFLGLASFAQHNVLKFIYVLHASLAYTLLSLSSIPLYE